MRYKTTKLFFSFVTLLFSLCVICFGVYSAVSVQFSVSGSINYEVPSVCVTNVKFDGETISTSKLILSKPNQIKSITDCLKPNVQLSPGRSELELNIVTIIDAYARMFVNYTPQLLNVKVNASSAYIKGSGIYKIYIDNNTSNNVTLSELNIGIEYDEQLYLLHAPNTTDESIDNDHHYIEMGTIMRPNSIKNEYIKWRLIGEVETSASSTVATQYTKFNESRDNLDDISGMFILETNVMISRNTDNAELNQVVFNNQYNNTTYKHTENEWQDVPANDYATSTIREYLNGINVYKKSQLNDDIYSPNQSTHFSNIFVDFNIDVSNDIIYKKITGRTLKDLYLENSFGGGGNYGYEVPFPQQLTQKGYTADTVDKLWLISAKEATILFEGNTLGVCPERVWASNAPHFWWLRSPSIYHPNCGVIVDGAGYMNDQESYKVSDNDRIVRPAFQITYA